jgi:acetyltransferase-like isoleucine patch superfamily enzyme
MSIRATLTLRPPAPDIDRFRDPADDLPRRRPKRLPDRRRDHDDGRRPDRGDPVGAPGEVVPSLHLTGCVNSGNAGTQPLMRLLERMLRPTVDRLVAERIEEERLDALYRYRVHSDPARLWIHPTAVVNNAIFNTGGGRITVGKYVFFGHNVCVLAGVHEVDKFGLERQQAIPRSGYDIEICEGAWLATNVLVAGPVKIGAHAVVGGGSVVRKDVPPYAVVAGNPARFIRSLARPGGEEPSE